ncbi:MAG: efflux RND transporter permease subunit [Burkholderiaceae bacterium]
MDIAAKSIEKPVNTWLIALICLLGGLWGLLTIGRLEDPAFTIKNAVVTTQYPGATAAEVEKEISEPLESAIQQMPELKWVKSKSVPGLSEITLEIQPTYDGSELPQIWTRLRNKVGDAAIRLPDGARAPMVNDDFGDVFGIFYAVVADGFSDAQKREVAGYLRRELLTVPGVAKIETQGEPTETIYVEISNQKLISLGVPLQEVIAAINAENVVLEGGANRSGDLRVRVAPPAGLDSAAAIASLRVGRAGTAEQISLLDIATIRRVPDETPRNYVRFDGKSAFTIAVAGAAGSNIVEVGKAVTAHLASIQPQIPLGVKLTPIYEQHVVVEQAMDGFIVNLGVSVAIVIGVLCLFMGWRVGIVVGITLLLTVFGTVLMMRLANIQMERISLGALIIAMGMLVDNAIVVAEGMLINMQRGMQAAPAASDAARRTQIPLLGATVIGIMAFSGIGLSPDATGEFLFSLFAVIALSLLLSWLLAITITPLFGTYLLKVKPGSASVDPYAGRSYGAYRWLLRGALRIRTLTIIALLATTVVSLYGFGQVKQQFFPDSSTPLFFVNYELRQGTDIRATARDIAQISRHVRAQPGVVSVASFIGQGASRFMLTYAPEQPNSAYGQLIVRAESLEVIDPLAAQLRLTLARQFPGAEIRTERLIFGPGGGAKIEARFQGPDPEVLRNLADKTIDVLRADGSIIDIRQNWRQRGLVIEPALNAERARLAGVSRADVGQALLYGSNGIRAGTYWEGDDEIPIVVRAPASERAQGMALENRLVWSSSAQTYLSMTQVVDRFETRAEETVIRRRDRNRTLTVLADPANGLTPDEALKRIKSEVEAIELPDGYSLAWGGEYENAGEAQASLGGQMPISFLVMFLISVLLFGKVRQPLIIWLVVPMAVCGVVAGLLGTGLPFSFTALLGLLSLSGMLMKNAIVLVDEIDAQIDEGKEKHLAIIDASVSRLRPVFLAAGTTILGMIPLLGDAFFASMAVTIMGGLAFASLLTLVAVPVFYSTLFRVRAIPYTATNVAAGV